MLKGAYCSLFYECCYHFVQSCKKCNLMHQDDNLQANQKFQFSNWRWKRSWKSIWAKAPANQYIDKLNELQKINRFPDESKCNWIKLGIKIDYFITQKDFQADKLTGIWHFHLYMWHGTNCSMDSQNDHSNLLFDYWNHWVPLEN